ncbi:AP-3 complex subunit sigma-1 [Anabarilius grahami]|uniref:AP-3 complex subunit sigma-1 n=1 Tax=Anabarilius grahami TaxID=495550 RepID=A0A3N0Z5X1_ANAGA|nr:AP-3 complex subunit sigma-1 [Anabarilius grahami]
MEERDTRIDQIQNGSNRCIDVKHIRFLAVFVRRWECRSSGWQAGIAGAPARAVSAVKNMNLPEMPKNINIGDISIKVPNLPSFK